MNKPLIRHIALNVARVISAGLLLCTLLGGYAGYIDPRTWAIPSMLCLVFPYMWLLLLLTGVLWLVLGKEKISALVCGIGLLTALPPLLAVSPFAFPQKLQSDEYPLKLLTYNVAHFQDQDKEVHDYSRTMSYIIDSGADIVCLQECYAFVSPRHRGSASESQMDSIHALYPYIIANGQEEETLLSKFPAELVSGYKQEGDTRYFNYQLYRIYVHGEPLSVLNVHLSSYSLTKQQKSLASNLKNNPSDMFDEEKNASLYRKLRSAFQTRARAADQLSQMIDTISGRLIVCGDFNDVPCSYTWRQVKNTGLQDAYLQAGKGPMITFNANHLLFHIDQVFYRPNLGMRAFEVTRGKIKSSDHYPVAVRFAIQNN